MRVIVENREAVLNEIIARNLDFFLVEFPDFQAFQVFALILVHLAEVIQGSGDIEREILEEMQPALQIDHKRRTHAHFLEKCVHSVARDHQRVLYFRDFIGKSRSFKGIL